jgi:hypothetical protein
MKISPAVSQALDVVKKSAETDQAIATTVLAKQQSVAKQQGDAVLQLLDSVPKPPSRGIDVRA